LLKKFLHGLVFGSGFGVAFVAIWIVGIWYVIPRVMETKFNEPEFDNPKVAEVSPSSEVIESKTNREFSFLKAPAVE
jgi:hypothetical protein